MKININKRIRYQIHVDNDWIQDNIIDPTWNRFVETHSWFEDTIIIEPCDSWSADYTLAKVIYPVLCQLKQNNHGFGFIRDEDVPENLRNDDEISEEKYDWVIDEIIWSMKQRVFDQNDEPDLPDDITGSMFDFTIKRSDEQNELVELWKKDMDVYGKRLENGDRLFGVYYTSLWD